MTAEKNHTDLTQTYDVLVVGGGNAALCAALTAREAGATVLILECAPKALRGGNSRHTRNIRYLHTSGNQYLTGGYPAEEFWDDLLKVTEGQTNKYLARLTLRQSQDAGEWMQRHGCVFQPAMRGTLHLARTNAFFLGGGKALLNAYYDLAEKSGVDTLYGAEARDLKIDGNTFAWAHILYGGKEKTVNARSVVIASGGFQANIKQLKTYWGAAADNFIIRGTPYNKGQMLNILLENGAQAMGDPRQCHAVAIDGRAPRFDGGIVTRLDCVPFGIVVNKNAERFYDEGEDFWPKRYAIWGRLVAQQPEQTAYAIVDAQSIDSFMPSVFPPVVSDTMQGLAEKLGIDSRPLAKTVSDFNKSVVPGTFNAAELDNCTTRGITPVKSHWARALNTPPYYGYPLRPGITFTYRGVKVNGRAQVLMKDNQPFANIFAAGEIMSGNILGKGYMAGFGMTIGTVFGRIAGRGAAKFGCGDGI